MLMKGLRISDSVIEYRVIEFDRFQIDRLSAQVYETVDDFYDFSSIYGKRANIAVENLSTSEAGVPPELLRSECGTVEFLTLRSLVSYWSRVVFEGSIGSRQVPFESRLRDRFEMFLSDLETRGKVALRKPSESDGADIFPPIILGDLGYLSRRALRSPQAYTLASGYSIIDGEECVSPFQSIRDPIGFRKCQGTATSLPLYARPVFSFSSSKVAIEYLPISQFLLRAKVGRHRSGIISGQSEEIAVFTRGSRITRTPLALGAIELVIVESKVVSITYGGGTNIPRAGAVVRLLREDSRSLVIEALREDNSIFFEGSEEDRSSSSLQCGPTLLLDGEIVLSRRLLHEEFFSQSACAFAGPKSIFETIGATRAARSAVGVRADGRPIAIIIEGTATGAQFDWDTPSVGATFLELARVCKNERLLSAMAMDSGGSVSLYRGSEQIVGGGDFRGTTRKIERPLAHAVLLQ